MFSVTGVPSVRVVHIDDPEYGENGKYFFFDGAEWSAMVGATSSSNWTSSILHVYQFRDGKFMWQGEVKVWDNDNGIHGRREPSSKAKSNQWQTGDIITVLKDGRAVSGTVTDGSSEQSACSGEGYVWTANRWTWKTNYCGHGLNRAITGPSDARAWPGFTTQVECSMTVDAHHDTNHHKAFTVHLNPAWVAPGMHVTLVIGDPDSDTAQTHALAALRVGHPTDITMTQVDQFVFGTKNGYTLQHREMLKQYLSLHVAFTRARLDKAIINTDFAQSAKLNWSPMTRTRGNIDGQFGGFNGLIGWSMALSGLTLVGCDQACTGLRNDAAL